MKPAPFEYHAPDDLEEVLATLAELGDEAKILAGGQSLVPMLNLRLARFGHLVDIGRVAELRGIERDNGSLVVKAGTRDAVVEFDPTVAADVPLLAAVTPYIGHFQIRNRGTIGGSLVHADPAAEYPAVAVALDATFDLVSASGARSVPASAFFTGVWSTALEEDELLRSIVLPGVERAVRVRRCRVRQAPRRLRHRRVGRRRRAGRPRHRQPLCDRRVRGLRHPGSGHGRRGRGRRSGRRRHRPCGRRSRRHRRHRRRRRRPPGAGRLSPADRRVDGRRRLATRPRRRCRQEHR